MCLFHAYSVLGQRLSPVLWKRVPSLPASIRHRCASIPRDPRGHEEPRDTSGTPGLPVQVSRSAHNLSLQHIALLRESAAKQVSAETPACGNGFGQLEEQLVRALSAVSGAAAGRCVGTRARLLHAGML